jgi:hypothetical protein
MHGAEPTNNGLGLRTPSATGLVVVNQLIWWGATDLVVSVVVGMRLSA